MAREKKPRTKVPAALKRMGLPESVCTAYLSLTHEQQNAFNREFKQRAKYMGSGYILWLLFGWHYVYVRRIGMQFAFWLTGGFLIIGWVIDFFRIPKIIRQFNQDLARKLMTEHKMMIG